MMKWRDSQCRDPSKNEKDHPAGLVSTCRTAATIPNPAELVKVPLEHHSLQLQPVDGDGGLVDEAEDLLVGELVHVDQRLPASCAVSSGACCA